MHFDAEFFVATGFVLFVLVMGYFGVHRMLASALDKRGEQIADELAEAKRLREEAEAVLASYKEKEAEAAKEAEAIVAQAREEAEAMARDAAVRMDEFVTRRTRQAEQKIAMAEAQASNDVRAAAADAAVQAAASVLKSQTAGATGGELIAKGIAEVKAKLH